MYHFNRPAMRQQAASNTSESFEGKPDDHAILLQTLLCCMVSKRQIKKGMIHTESKLPSS